MKPADVLEIIYLCRQASFTPDDEYETVESVVDVFFNDSGLEQLSNFFATVKTGLKSIQIPREDEVYMIREIIAYITEQYEKKYGEEVSLRVFMHLNMV